MIQNHIRTHALSLGFSAVGFVPAELPERAKDGLREFLASGHHGDMKWMEDRAHLRADPKALWPEAKSVIVVGHNYGPAENPMKKLEDKNTGNISVYAQNLDYHDVIKKKLKELARWVAKEYGCDVKVFVDTAPVMEKPLAEAAGLGWQGKHTCLVSREFGSWLFLGSVFTTLDITFFSPLRGEIDSLSSLASLENLREGEYLADSGSKGAAPSPTLPPTGGGSRLCGSCTRCLDVCPTRAFTSCGKLDARKCLAYLTIEHKGAIPLEYREAMGNRIYGCDDCLAVCPWNKFAEEASDAAYHARESLKAPDLGELAALDDASFRTLFSKSPIKRIGRNKFVSNVLIAIGNSGNPDFIPAAEKCASDASELVREAAMWATKRLQSASV